MNKIKFIILVLFLVSCSNQHKESISVTSKEVITDFDTNEKAAIEKYKNKIVQIKGTVELKEFAKDNIPSRNASDIIFADTDKDKWLYFEGNTLLICMFNDLSVHRLNYHEEVIINATFKKFKQNINSLGMNEIIFVDSVILKPELTRNETEE